MHDCLIVGGGVIGLSIAYELAGHDLSCLVLDQGRVGQESSWAGAGILPASNPASAIDPIDQLRGFSHQLHPAWSEQLKNETGIDNGFQQPGGIHLARTSGEAAALAGWTSSLADEGIQAEKLDSQQLTQLEPGLAQLADSGELLGAYLIEGEGQIRNPHHLAALKAGCLARGVEIHEQLKVTAMACEQGRMTHVEAGEQRWFAESFCLTAGAWSGDLLRQLNINNGILPIRGQMVLFKCSQPPLLRVINEGSRYLVPRRDGRLLVGSSEEEVGFANQTTHEMIEQLTQFGRQLLVALETADVERSWAGLRPASFDGFPYLGALPAVDNAFVAAGHFRSGLQLSTGTAVVMSQLIRGETTSLDLLPFGLQRG